MHLETTLLFQTETRRLIKSTVILQQRPFYLATNTECGHCVLMLEAPFQSARVLLGILETDLTFSPGSVVFCQWIMSLAIEIYN